MEQQPRVRIGDGESPLPKRSVETQPLPQRRVQQVVEEKPPAPRHTVELGANKPVFETANEQTAHRKQIKKVEDGAPAPRLAAAAGADEPVAKPVWDAAPVQQEPHQSELPSEAAANPAVEYVDVPVEGFAVYLDVVKQNLTLAGLLFVVCVFLVHLLCNGRSGGAEAAYKRAD